MKQGKRGGIRTYVDAKRENTHAEFTVNSVHGKSHPAYPGAKDDPLVWLKIECGGEVIFEAVVGMTPTRARELAARLVAEADKSDHVKPCRGDCGYGCPKPGEEAARA